MNTTILNPSTLNPSACSAVAADAMPNRNRDEIAFAVVMAAMAAIFSLGILGAALG